MSPPTRSHYFELFRPFLGVDFWKNTNFSETGKWSAESWLRPTNTNETPRQTGIGSTRPSCRERIFPSFVAAQSLNPLFLAPPICVAPESAPLHILYNGRKRRVESRKHRWNTKAFRWETPEKSAKFTKNLILEGKPTKKRETAIAFCEILC